MRRRGPGGRVSSGGGGGSDQLTTAALRCMMVADWGKGYQLPGTAWGTIHWAAGPRRARGRSHAASRAPGAHLARARVSPLRARAVHARPSHAARIQPRTRSDMERRMCVRLQESAATLQNWCARQRLRACVQARVMATLRAAHTCTCPRLAVAGIRSGQSVGNGFKVGSKHMAVLRAMLAVCSNLLNTTLLSPSLSPALAAPATTAAPPRARAHTSRTARGASLHHPGRAWRRRRRSSASE